MGTEGIGIFGDIEADGLIVGNCNEKTADKFEAPGYITILPAENFLYDVYLALS